MKTFLKPRTDVQTSILECHVIRLLIFFQSKTYYATDSTLVCPVKVEYGPENNIFVLKMMIKSGLEKNILKFLYAQSLFWKIFFTSGEIFASNCKFGNKNDLLCTWRNFNKTFCGISTYHKWMFKLQISFIFNFDRAHQSWSSGVLGVKQDIFFAPENWNKKFLFKTSSKCLVSKEMRHCI